jgi:hypothetical protein
MSNGLCPNCGTPAPVHASSCDRCGASLGRAFIELTPRDASKGSARPTVVSTRSRKGVAPLLVLLAALAVVAGGLAVVLGGGGDDSLGPSSPTTTPGPTTTAAPTTSVQRQPGAAYFENTPGPVLGRPAQGALYVADGSVVKRIDLATGTITKTPAISLDQSPEARQVVAVEGGFFVAYESGDVVAFRDDFTQAPVNVGRGAYVVDAGVTGTVWIAGGSECAGCKTLDWYEAGLGGPTGSSIELARTLFPVAAIDRGLVWQTPSGIFTGRSRASARRYATGTLVAARGDTVVWYGCDDIVGTDCRYHVGDGRDADKRQFDVVDSVGRPSATHLERLGTFPLSVDALALPRSNDARLPLLDLENGTVSTLSTGSSFSRARSMHWTANGEWLFIHASKTVVRAVNARTGGTAEVTLPVESSGEIAIAAR